MNTKKIIKQIEVRQTAIAKERDQLDEMIAQLSELSESCEKAWDALQDARDALSELV